MENMGEGLILNLGDIDSFFDREDILDVVEALEDMEVNKKLIRLLYKPSPPMSVCWWARAPTPRPSAPRPW